VEPLKIYDKKVEHIKKMDSIPQNILKCIGAPDHEGASKVLEHICDNMIKFIILSLESDFKLSRFDKIKRSIAFDYLKSLFGRDIRACFSAITNIMYFIIKHYHDDFSMEILGSSTSNRFRRQLIQRHYLVFEALILGREDHFYQSFYMYGMLPGSTNIQIIRYKKPSFIGNPFNFPILSGRKKKNQMLLLCGIKMLIHVDNAGECSSNDLLDFLSERFNYNRLYSEIILDELIYNGFLIENCLTNMLTITKMGKHMLTTWIYNATFLNFATHSTPLFIQDLESVNFKLVKVNDPTFACYLIKNVAHFIRTIKLVENKEEDVFNSNLTREEKRMGWTFRKYGHSNCNYSIVDNLKGKKLDVSIAGTSKRIIDQAKMLRGHKLYRELQSNFLKE